jgi:DNA-binding LacI/PurR family transcriptional regulator
LVASAVQFDAIFAGDDDSAIGAMAALQEAGLRVPEDVSVVGFDDQRTSAYLTPPLTTVRAPTEEVGQAAARQLLNLLRGTQADPLTLLPTEIVIRRSCGCQWSPG